MWFRPAALAVSLLLTLSACGSAGNATRAGGSGTSTTVDPETPVSSTPDPDGEPASPHDRYVEPKPGQAGVHPIRWQKIVVGKDDKTLRIHYTSGVEPCYVLDHIEVDEKKDRVVVTLFEG